MWIVIWSFMEDLYVDLLKCLLCQVWSDTIWGWKQESDDGEQRTLWVDSETAMFWGMFITC